MAPIDIQHFCIPKMLLYGTVFCELINHEACGITMSAAVIFANFPSVSPGQFLVLVLGYEGTLSDAT